MNFFIVALCAIGLYVSAFMQAKAARASRGDLDEPSVVQTPRARLFGGVPNSLFGIAYYALLGAASFFLRVPAVHAAALGAACLAAATSLYLAYSLLFVTKMPCPNCWIGHVVNWALLCVLLFART